MRGARGTRKSLRSTARCYASPGLWRHKSEASTTEEPIDLWNDPRLAAFLDLALAEDVGTGDRTSDALVAAGAQARGRLLAKESLVVCGLPLLARVFRRLGAVTVETHVAEGACAAPGEVVAVLDGDARALLAGERLTLNILQHLCGIATLTRASVGRVKDT